jgi:hypothetical protein
MHAWDPKIFVLVSSRRTAVSKVLLNLDGSKNY